MESDPLLPAEPDAETVPQVPPCPTCGAVPADGSNFCPSCGAPLRENRGLPARRLSSRQILQDVNLSSGPVHRPLIFFLSWVAIGAIFSTLAYTGAITVHLMMAMDVLTTSLTLVWATAGRRDVFHLFRFPRGGVLWMALPVLTAWPIAAAVNLLVGWINGLIGFEFQYTPLFFDHGYGWAWIALIMFVQPALVEELAFRGILFTSLADVMKPSDAILVSAIAFAIMHFDVGTLIPFTLLGAYLAWMRVRTESLWPGIVAHFAHNLLVVLDERVSILPG